MKSASSPAPKLAELQRWLSWIITEPRDAASALKRPGAKAPKRDCRRLIAELPPIGAAERIDIYGFAYYERLIEALSADFEGVRARLTERDFRQLAREYIRKHPSSSYTVSWVGKELPSFLKRHRLSRKYPYLADLARLDWAELHAFFARDPEPWNPASFSALAPEDWGKVKFRLGDSATLLSSDWKIDVFRERKKGVVARGKRRLAVFRDLQFRVRIEVLDEMQWDFLSSASKGQPLARICSRLPAGAPVGDWMAAWCASGLLRPVPWFTGCSGASAPCGGARSN